MHLCIHICFWNIPLLTIDPVDIINLCMYMICNSCWCYVSAKVYIWLSWWNQGLRDGAYFVYVSHALCTNILHSGNTNRCMLGEAAFIPQSIHYFIQHICPSMWLVACLAASHSFPRPPSTTVHSTTPLPC